MIYTYDFLRFLPVSHKKKNRPDFDWTIPHRMKKTCPVSTIEPGRAIPIPTVTGPKSDPVGLYPARSQRSSGELASLYRFRKESYKISRIFGEFC